MKERKFYVVFIHSEMEYPESDIIKLRTHEHGKTEKLITEIGRELKRKYRISSSINLCFMNLIELDD